MIKALLVLISLWNGPAFAGDDDMDASTQKALKQTQDMLRNPDARDKAIKGDPKAEDIDQKVGVLAGSKGNKDDMYDLAAQLMEKVAAESKGDPDKMAKMMQQAQKDPKAFYEKYFSEAQKAKVRDIATKKGDEGPKLNP